MVTTQVSIPRYQVSEQLYNGSRTLVYRGYRETDSVPVVIKLLKNPYPSFSELLSFRNQYTIAKNLNSPLIIQTYSLEPYQNGYALVMEDFGGISLKEYFTSDQTQYITSGQEFLLIAIALCNALDILYHERIIHKDIKPSNILINPLSKQVKIIDFSIASLLPREMQTLVNPDVLEGTLAYLSPEQTGRMNRGIDYRTDFYSLGVTFYELLTGELPFKSHDAMELVHCHLAKLPDQFKILNSKFKNGQPIPQVLCDIVMKLMAKNAEDRYQSSLGLKFDLEKCLTELQETGEIEIFPIAQRDLCDHFIIPDKLYGRETEVSTLLQAFERVSLGATEMMLVAGFSGIGKTAVVNEVHKPIVRQRGYFIKGKYDQFQRNIPFSAFVQAFRDLMGQLLTNSDAQTREWKSRILEAVGENGQVIIEVIPELETIIGQQPPAPELSGTAAQNRFNLLFQKFTQVFTSASHPLVIFLDDLQWADSASLKLMQLLMADTSHLLLIGAYRDNEVNPAHPLMLTLGEMQKTQATINTITLTPLSQWQVNQLVVDTLKCTENVAWSLAQLVSQKTQGNPFFATQFLKALHQDGLIQFDFESGCWQCDIVQVNQQAVTDDVVAFMAFQLQRLLPSTQNVLQLAACIGNQFDLRTLAIVLETSEIETAACLWKALQFGLILPTGEVYKFYQDGNSSLLTVDCKQLTVNGQPSTNYKFLHDRVQQAAYSLIPDSHKEATHLKIGRLLLQETPPEERKDNIFVLVNQLNYGTHLLSLESEKYELAELNLIAGQKAKTSAAYEAAHRYLKVGLNLLAVSSWLHQYELTLALYELAVETAYLNGDFEQMEQWADVVLQQAKTFVDKMKVYAVKIQANMAQIKKMAAVKIGLQALELLGISLPESPDSSEIQQALAQTATNLEGKNIEDLINLPLMTDVEKLAAAKMLASMVPSTYQAAPILFPLIVCELVNLSIKYGNSPFSSYGYACYGNILNAVFQNIESAYNFGKLALNLAEQFNAPDLKASVFLTVGASTIHIKVNVRETLPIFWDAYQSGLESGNFEFSGYAAALKSVHSYFIGQELTVLEREMAIMSDALAQINQENTLGSNQIFQQSVLNLLNPSENPYDLQGEVYNEEKYLARLKDANDRTNLHFLYLNKLILSYLFREYEKARENALQAEQYLDGVQGYLLVPVFHFYDSLAHLAIYQSVPHSQQEHLWSRVTNNQQKMKHWATHAPMNFQHKFDLVAAQQCQILGNKAEAMDLYDRAITLAKENGYIQEEALANELAAKFYLHWGKEKVAQAYIQEAYYCYARWGALAKVNHLEKSYPQLLQPILQQQRLHLNPQETLAIHGTSSSSSISDVLDLTSVLKAAQAISISLELDQLIASLTRIILENSGAKKSVLLLPHQDTWQVRAITLIDEPTDIQTISTTQLLDTCQDIPVRIIHYVKNTQQTIVIDNCKTDIPGVIGEYMLQHQPQSVLCTPIINQANLVGILYLENDLTSGVFTRHRLNVIHLLSSQAAISLENARLYQQAQQALLELQQAQLQIVQSEKMSALGNLVAGVAHEMNNPLGFIAATLKQAKPTLAEIFEHLKLYQESLPNPSDEIKDHGVEIDLDYSLEDLPKMINSMTIACDRLKNISTSLRTFSRADKDYKVPFNIHSGIDSTILILKHRLKANEERPAIEVITEYGNIPEINCFPGQLNQVFMNILANAIDALEESNIGRTFAEIQGNPNRIIIQTLIENSLVKITIADNALGMSEQVKQKVFDHSFTTKAVGKGTGLGLAIARQIVESTHGGKLSFHSVQGVGTEFLIEIPV